MFRKTFGFEGDYLNTLIHNDPRQCTCKLANVMNCGHSTIVRHLNSVGKVKKIGCMGTACCKPKLRKSADGHKRTSTCSSSMCSWTTWPFLSCIVTGKKKWCFYANIRKRKEWLSPNMRRMCRKCSNFSAWYSHFLAFTAPLTVYKWQNFNM